MVVNPKDCLEPTEADYEKRNQFCDRIDLELKNKFITPGMTITVRYADSDYNIRVVRMVISLYQDAGWHVEPGSDASYDPRDGEMLGGPYLRFSA